MSLIKIGLSLLCLKGMHERAHSKAHGHGGCHHRHRPHHGSGCSKPSTPPVMPPQPPAVNPGAEKESSQPDIKPISLSSATVLAAAMLVSYMAITGLGIAIAVHVTRQTHERSSSNQREHAHNSQAQLPPQARAILERFSPPSDVNLEHEANLRSRFQLLTYEQYTSSDDEETQSLLSPEYEYRGGGQLSFVDDPKLAKFSLEPEADLLEFDDQEFTRLLP